jgi:organic hydroperoxide reductase OsmC/OhrA
LLVGAVADCFILTFRALADSSQVPWTSLRCDAVGTVDRIERVTRFSEIILRARLQVPDGTDQEKARRVLEKAERSCLISNSLSVPVHLEADIHMARTAA